MQKLLEGVTNSISVRSGCEIFRRFITLVSMDALGAEESRTSMIQRGIVFYNRCSEAQNIISKLGTFTAVYISNVVELLFIIF